MKTFLSILTLLLPVVTWGANPSFSSFSTNQFNTTGNKIVIKNGAIVTNLITQGITGTSAAFTNDVTVGTTNVTGELSLQPAFTDFNTGQFETTGNKVVIKSGANITNANLINPTLGGISSLTISGTMTAAELDVALIVTTNGLAFSDTLVAALGTPTGGTFPIKYSSDVVTSSGLGGYVRWDGSVWKTWENVQATADVDTFILKAVNSRLMTTTPKSTIMNSSALVNNLGSGMVPRYLALSGTGATWSFVTARTWGGVGQHTTGTTTNGNSALHGAVEAIVSGDKYACGGRYSVLTACDATETYAVIMGFNTLAFSTFPTTGAVFLYDMMNTFGHNQTYTNNWICVTAVASSYSYADSGLPVSISSTVLDDLGIIMTCGGNVKFYTNGVICATIAASVSSGTVLEANNWIMQKRNAVTGTTARIAYEGRPWFHFRWNTPRVFQ